MASFWRRRAAAALHPVEKVLIWVGYLTFKSHWCILNYVYTLLDILAFSPRKFVFLRLIFCSFFKSGNGSLLHEMKILFQRLRLQKHAMESFEYYCWWESCLMSCPLLGMSQWLAVHCDSWSRCSSKGHSSAHSRSRDHRSFDLVVLWILRKKIAAYWVHCSAGQFYLEASHPGQDEGTSYPAGGWKLLSVLLLS